MGQSHEVRQGRLVQGGRGFHNRGHIWRRGHGARDGDTVEWKTTTGKATDSSSGAVKAHQAYVCEHRASHIRDDGAGDVVVVGAPAPFGVEEIL
jgi:hypothetical protein